MKSRDVRGQAARWKGMAADMSSSHVCGLDVSGLASASFLPLKTRNKVRISGVIDAVGEEVEGWAVGDAVLYHGAQPRIRNTFIRAVALTRSRLLVSSQRWLCRVRHSRLQVPVCCVLHVTRHASRVTRHTSHVTPGPSWPTLVSRPLMLRRPRAQVPGACPALVTVVA